MKYDIQFQFVSIAEVEIDGSQAARKAMEQMVNFWANSDERLEANNGDLTQAFCKMLGTFIMENRRAPDFEKHGDEGWLPLDGTHRIKILGAYPFEIDEDEDIDVYAKL